MCYCDSNVLSIFEEEIKLKKYHFLKNKAFCRKWRHDPLCSLFHPGQREFCDIIGNSFKDYKVSSTWKHTSTFIIRHFFRHCIILSQKRGILSCRARPGSNVPHTSVTDTGTGQLAETLVNLKQGLERLSGDLAALNWGRCTSVSPKRLHWHPCRDVNQLQLEIQSRTSGKQHRWKANGTIKQTESNLKSKLYHPLPVKGKSVSEVWSKRVGNKTHSPE